MDNDKKGNNYFIFILLVIVVVAVFFFPKINEYIVKITSPKVEQSKNEKKEEKKFDKSIIEDIHFPVMRTSVYSTTTNYSKDKFTISDIGNKEILLNAFLDMHEGNIVSLGSSARCGGTSAEFDQKYLELRIKNILGRNINYTLESFEVPEGNDTTYPGTWTYDSAGKKFVYDGVCNKNAGNIKYYDLKQLKEGKYEGSDLILYYYVGFAKVQDGRFSIYGDVKMDDEICGGPFVSESAMQTTFESCANHRKKIYKYVFKNNICTYNDYCLYEGSWN